MTTNKTSANVTETESSPITILSAEKQAFAALFCKGIVRQVTKQMHNLFAKNGSLHSPEQPMPVLLCGHFAFPQFWRPWCSEQTSFSKKTNRLFIKHFQCFARNFPNRGSPESVTAIRKLKCTDPLKNNPLSTRSQRLRYAKYTKCHRFLLQCRFWIRILYRKRLRTQPASRREGTQLSRKVNEMPPSFLKLNSPFRTPFRTFFRFRIWCSSYAFGPFCGFELKTHQIRPDFALSHRFQALKDDTEQKTARFRHKKKNIFQSPI